MLIQNENGCKILCTLKYYGLHTYPRFQFCSDQNPKIKNFYSIIVVECKESDAGNSDLPKRSSFFKWKGKKIVCWDC